MDSLNLISLLLKGIELKWKGTNLSDLFIKMEEMECVFFIIEDLLGNPTLK